MSTIHNNNTPLDVPLFPTDGAPITATFTSDNDDFLRLIPLADIVHPTRRVRTSSVPRLRAKSKQKASGAPIYKYTERHSLTSNAC